MPTPRPARRRISIGLALAVCATVTVVAVAGREEPVTVRIDEGRAGSQGPPKAGVPREIARAVTKRSAESAVARDDFSWLRGQRQAPSLSQAAADAPAPAPTEVAAVRTRAPRPPQEVAVRRPSPRSSPNRATRPTTPTPAAEEPTQSAASSPPPSPTPSQAAEGPPSPSPEPPPPPPPPSPSVHIAKAGSAVGQPGCTHESCAWISVSISNFRPNASLPLRCHSSGGAFWDAVIRSDGNGNGSARPCYWGFPGQRVWVEVDGVRSNEIVW